MALLVFLLGWTCSYSVGESLLWAPVLGGWCPWVKRCSLVPSMKGGNVPCFSPSWWNGFLEFLSSHSEQLMASLPENLGFPLLPLFPGFICFLMEHLHLRSLWALTCALLNPVLLLWSLLLPQPHHGVFIFLSVFCLSNIDCQWCAGSTALCPAYLAFLHSHSPLVPPVSLCLLSYCLALSRGCPLPCQSP